MTWTLVDISDDTRMTSSEDDDRWLLIYEVPREYAAGGQYSVSVPKSMMTSLAATYGYDVDNPDDLDEMMEYVTYQPYMAEVARREGRAHEAAPNPYEMGYGVAREIFKHRVDEFKSQGHVVVHAPQSGGHGARMLATAGEQPAEMALHDLVKQDLVARVDKVDVDARRESTLWVIDHSQREMMSAALRMNATIDRGRKTT